MKSWLGIAVLALTACEGSRISDRAPGEPATNDLMHQRTEARHAPPILEVAPRDPTPAELREAETGNATAETYARAISFYTASEKPHALAVLDRAERVYPSGERWRWLRARLYFQGLVGSHGALPYGVVHTIRTEDARGKFALEIRRRLARSKDPHLLLLVAREVGGAQLPDSGPNKLPFDRLALAKSYVEQATLAGAEPTAAEATLTVIHLAKGRNELSTLLSGERRPEDVLAEATPAQKLLLLELIMASASRRDERERGVRAARAALELTASQPETPQTLQSQTNARLMLGKMALRSGDAKTAIREMMASVQPSFPGRAHSFELARSLLDWGYREDVAHYLELAAHGHRDSKRLTAWAELIRQGRNPDLTPYETGCAKEPC